MSGVNIISLCTVRLTARRLYPDGRSCGSASMTGFVWRNNGQLYLITNWHNVTGRNPITDEYMGYFAPSHIACECRVLNKASNTSAKISFELSLFDEHEQQNWIEHPTGKKVDVVAIPFVQYPPESYEFVALNESDFENDCRPQIGDEGFIIGYPEGFAGAYTTPIWKRGSIASEPYLDFEGQPYFLMDTIGNKGLSGSAVIGRGTGILRKSGSSEALSGSDIIGTWQYFLGIYSGRMSEEGIGSQLGRVWKASTIADILNHTVS